MRSSFVLAALVLAWLAVGLLAVAVANLVARVTRLEAGPTASGPRPYAHVRGRELGDLLPPLPPPPPLPVVVLVSPGCRTCDRLVAELGPAGPQRGVHVAWVDGRRRGDGAVPAGDGPVPGGDVPVLDGRAVASRLGVTVTPFAVALDATGRVLDAAPVGSTADIERLRAADPTTVRLPHRGGP